MQDDTVHVAGSATYATEASMFTLRIRVKAIAGLKSKSSGADLDKEADTLLHSVLDRLEDMGVPNTALFFQGQSDQVLWQVNPQRDRLTHSLLVRLDDIETYARLPDALGTLETRKSSLHFEILPPVFPDDTQARADAFASALQSAQTIAKAMAAGQGRTLGGLLSVEDMSLFGESQTQAEPLYTVGFNAPSGNGVRDVPIPVKELRVQVRALFALTPQTD